MGFFANKKKRKGKKGFQGMLNDDNSMDHNINDWKGHGGGGDYHDDHDDNDHEQQHNHETHDTNQQPTTSSSSTSSKDNANTNNTNTNDDSSLENLQSLVNDLAMCNETYAEEPARALRELFALSEHHSMHEINRIRMIREANSTLVPTLLAFLQQCQPNSSEQYLALLVLNNVSIPSENKRIIALDCKGVKILSKMLCWHPESSLICIILVNLCFCDAMLRNELVMLSNRVYLVEGLAYVLMVSILPEGEELPIALKRDMTPLQLLRQLQAHTYAKTNNNTDTTDKKSPTDNSDNDLSSSMYSPRAINVNLPFSPKVTHTETARWCLCGIKNLSRPSKDPIAAQALIQSGILDVVLRVLSIGSASHRQASNDFHKFSSNEFKGINIDHEIHYNDPYTWDANSMQDAALYIVMNLALTPVTRLYLRNEHVARKLSVIARYSSSPNSIPAPSQSTNINEHKTKQEKQKDLQCLKARMTLAYLFGSEHNFGQARSSTPSYHDAFGLETKQELLLIKGSEAPLLVELLANTLHSRGKVGPGGYNGSTFNAKKALYAIRCLLTNSLNVKTFFVTCGVKLNVLLLKALALHSIQEVPNVDLEAAEDACFSIYLLSNHGFMGAFLPSEEEGYPFKNIIHCYAQKKTCTAAGKHAAMQLLLRHAYLQFDGNLDDDEPKNIVKSDLELGDALCSAALEMEVFGNTVGAEPMDDIFGRPLTRRRLAPIGGKMPTPWDSNVSVASFNSALDSVQELSFGSGLHEKSGGFIDDIEIANNIAKTANGKNDDGEAYGFEWSWQDGNGAINEKDVRKKLNDFRSGKMDAFKGLLRNVSTRERPTEPITIFGINCGCNSVVVE